ncbi:MAG TPA: PAS domain S-box protein [Gemmatimonadales bacterium]|nr:PAS domain S-box protein [Gemmatimonadales bacterium]
MTKATFPGERRRHQPDPDGGAGQLDTAQLYRSIGEAAPGFLWVVDESGRFVYVNKAWEDFTGSNLRQLNEHGWEQFNHPAEIEAVQHSWQAAIERGESFAIDLRYRRRDGVYRWMLTRVAPLRGSAGVEGWVGTSVDIHDFKLAQEELRAREEELNDFLENASVAIHWVGPDGTILRSNQAELDLLGYRHDEYVGRNIREFHTEPAVIEDILARLTRGEVLHDYPASLLARDGSHKDVLIDSSVYFRNGQFVHTRCFTRDVTAQRAAEHATQRLAAIVASSADAIVGKTLDGLVTNWNAAAERIFGYSASEMVGGSIFRLIPEELHDAERALLSRIRNGEWVQLSETERICQDGRRISVSLSASPIRDSLGRVIGASSIARDVTERKQAEAALAHSQERLQLALTAARMGTWHYDLITGGLSWDENINQLYGLDSQTAIRTREDFLLRIHEDDRSFVRDSLARAMSAGNRLECEFRTILPDGKVRWMAVQGRVARDPVAGTPLYVTGVSVDVTERKAMEERLRQVQRMDSVGQLAGGIAHEANNMMSVVLGCADYVLQRDDLADPVRQDVEQIWRAAKRTAGITQQLLAFSRRQLLQPQVLDLNATVRGLEPILARALGESRAVRMHLSPTLGPVRTDPGQLEQVLLNLTLNARDAMGEGGRLTIETMNVMLDENYAAGKPVETLQPGEYAALVVTDTGHGMDQLTLSRIFEPFFTTKPVGQGTGLGLSTVYGIVKQSGGFIWAYSEPGLGTTFKLYFPIVSSEVPVISEHQPSPAGRSEEVVLIAEDEPMVRSIMARTLRECGYTVLEAADGQQALEVLKTEKRPISLIIADVVMPDMGGQEMARRLTEWMPGAPVLFTSGYTGLDVVSRGLLEPGREFLQKPLAPETLARKVREMVDARLPVS